MGGFGISSRADPLRVEDVVLVPQRAAMAFVAFHDAAVADHFDQQVDAGRKPEEFARIWLHTHPGHSPGPSGTDEQTFARVFGGCDWAVMGILARGGASYARLRFAAGPSGSLRIPVEVDYVGSFAATDEQCWLAEYRRCVQPVDVRGRSRKLEGPNRHLAEGHVELAEEALWLDPFLDSHHGLFEPDFAR